VQNYYARYCRDEQGTDWRDWPYPAGNAARAGGRQRVPDPRSIDDVINVAGHRLGTKELQSASITVEEIAEATVVP
jgi:acetyl-CoA synthetase